MKEDQSRLTEAAPLAHSVFSVFSVFSRPHDATERGYAHTISQHRTSESGLDLPAGIRRV